jgi:predicted hydrolase (HD superfamily)
MIQYCVDTHIEIDQYDCLGRRIRILEQKRALEFVKKHIRTRNLLKHMLATEAVMKGLARRFGEDEESWGL